VQELKIRPAHNGGAIQSLFIKRAQKLHTRAFNSPMKRLSFNRKAVFETPIP
jgi:hypothetical protein